MLLKIAGMSSSSYFDARKRAYGAHFDSDYSIVEDIKAIRAGDNESESLGYRPLTILINVRRQGRKETPVNHKRVLRVMRQNGLLSYCYKKKTAKYNSYEGSKGGERKNYIRGRFTTDRPLQKIGTDVTEARWGAQTTDERLYISLFTDFYSGEILSHSISLHPNTEFVLESLEPVIDMLKETPYLTTIHLDQGSQYQSGKYRAALKQNHIRQSMSRKSSPCDNAPTESLIHQLKVGTVLDHQYATQRQLEEAISNWINYYNFKRIRQSNSWRTPNEMRNNYVQKLTNISGES